MCHFGTWLRKRGRGQVVILTTFSAGAAAARQPVLPLVKMTNGPAGAAAQAADERQPVRASSWQSRLFPQRKLLSRRWLWCSSHFATLWNWQSHFPRRDAPPRPLWPAPAPSPRPSRAGRRSSPPSPSRATAAPSWEGAAKGSADQSIILSYGSAPLPRWCQAPRARLPVLPTARRFRTCRDLLGCSARPHLFSARKERYPKLPYPDSSFMPRWRAWPSRSAPPERDLYSIKRPVSPQA
jgi:hypothetical protein